MKWLYAIACSYKLVMVYITEKGNRDGDRESMVMNHLSSIACTLLPHPVLTIVWCLINIDVVALVVQNNCVIQLSYLYLSTKSYSNLNQEIMRNLQKLKIFSLYYLFFWSIFVIDVNVQYMNTCLLLKDLLYLSFLPCSIICISFIFAYKF